MGKDFTYSSSIRNSVSTANYFIFTVFLYGTEKQVTSHLTTVKPSSAQWFLLIPSLKATPSS